ncbi:MAG: NYN domain-containing protein [Bernardetiaceae bacterium]|nr:NYN domain-containing protein [Bernardetiaceae bacterium]
MRKRTNYSEALFEDSNRTKLALLIDGDNAQPKLLNKILAELGKYGAVTIRRIYGDWTTSNMNGWKEYTNDLAIQPIQQFRYTTGKNATDSAMIIDAMDILHGEEVEAFCIVSSDSDYTRLATRIRESGTFVMGIGQQKTPKSFVNACDLFIYTENLLPQRRTPKTIAKSTAKSTNKVPTQEAVAMKKAEANDMQKESALLREAFESASSEEDWLYLAQFGAYLRRIDPGFDPRTYGYKQLSEMLKAHSQDFEMKKQRKNNRFVTYVRLKES